MRTLTIVKTDFKNIFRDPSLIMIFVVPALLVPMLRYIPSNRELFSDSLRISTTYIRHILSYSISIGEFPVNLCHAR